MITRFILCLLLASLGAVAQAIPPIVITQDDIRYVYDGDTFYIDCFAGLRCKKGKLGIRALGFDTPEMRGDCTREITQARHAKQYLVQLKNDAEVIVIYPDLKRPYDKYGRLLAHVHFDGVDWSDSMINAGLGRAWNGRRGGWC